MHAHEIENIFSKTKKQEREENKPKLKITADHREKNSLVISELTSQNIEVEMQHLQVADFLVGDVAIERKTISDFLSSMMNKRLIEQLENLKQYEKSFLIIEGIDEQEIYNDKNYIENGGIHPNAIRGFLLSIILEHKIPIIFTKNYEDTARFLIVLRKKQEKGRTEMSKLPKRKASSAKEQKYFILEGFPGIGPKTARELIKKFGSIKEIVNASPEDLKEVLGKKADSFLKLLD